MTVLFTVRCLVLLGHGAVVDGGVVERVIQFVQSLPLDEEPTLQLLRTTTTNLHLQLLLAVTKNRTQQ